MREFNRRTQWLRFLGAGCVLAGAVSYTWTRTPWNEFHSGIYVLDFIIFILFMVSPAIYWESLCRLTPRGNNLYGAMLSSAIRIVVFLPVTGWSYELLLRIYIAAHKWLQPNTAWWPTIYEAHAVGIATAFLLLVTFDYVCAKILKRNKGDVA